MGAADCGLSPRWVFLFLSEGEPVKTTRPIAAPAIEERRTAINHLMEEAAQLAEQEVSLAEFAREILRITLMGFGYVAAAVWTTTPQGHLHLLAENRLRSFEEAHGARAAHDELRRAVGSRVQPLLVPARGGDGCGPQNPTPHVGFLVPIVLNKKLAGLIEVWRQPAAVPEEHRYCLHVLASLATLAATHRRAAHLRHISSEKQVWTQLEAFTRSIHGSLDPTVVSYRVANEGRRLIGCDRVSVALAHGPRTRVEAVSGAAIVEERANLVRRLGALADAVRQWGEPLSYDGTRDESLPPAVLDALDLYLAESSSTHLLVLPMRGEEGTKVHSVLIAESFRALKTAEPLRRKAEVIARHAGTALGNAQAHRRIPVRWLWSPLARLQDGVGGKTRAISLLSAVAVLALIATLVFVPYPLKMDAKGQLLPQARAWVYPPVEGHVVRFEVTPGMEVYEGQPLVLMHDSSLEVKLVNLNKEIEAAEKEIQGCNARFEAARTNEAERLAVSIERRKHETVRELKTQERDRLRALTGSDESSPGRFWVRSPVAGTILNFDFRENLTGKFVRPSEPLLRIGDRSASWEVELKIPQKHIGQVLAAFETSGAKELDIDLLPLSAPTKAYRGKLSCDQIAGEATPDAEDRSETEPTVSVRVRIDGSDIPAGQRLPRHLLLTGSEVHAKVRCGDRAMGYSLFYGAWEFFFEKVVFFF